MARKNGSKRGSHNRRLRNENKELQELLANNAMAIEEGPSKKHWSIHDILEVKPLTPTQEDMFQDFFQGYNICAYGSAGTGKTFLSMYLAFSEIFRKGGHQNKVIIVRSAVPSRDIGHMPGDYDEKIALYEAPYVDICQELFGTFNAYNDLKAAGKVKFMTTSYMRGVTWDNAIVLVDEGQNMTFHEINTIMTRVGVNTRLIFAGDMPQTDLRKHKNDTSGMADLLHIIERMENFSCIKFTHDDIVRSEFVKSWIIAAEEELT